MKPITVATLKTDAKNRRDGLERPITWLVIDERDHAVLVRTTGGDLWLQKSAVRAAFPVKGCHCYDGVENVAARIIEAADAITRHKGEALVEVTGIGPGKTEKSVKIGVRLWDVSKQRTYAQRNEPWPLTRTVTFMVPASLVTEHDGKLFAPRWVLVEKFEKSAHKNREVMIPLGRWPGLDALRADVQTAFDSLFIEKNEIEREAA